MALPTVAQLFDLTGRTFLVVGGARTLGYDMALALAEAGATGVITSRTAENAVSAAGKISQATGKDVTGIGVDANDEASVAAGVAQALAKLGRLDIVVNNVGGGGGGANAGSTKLEERLLATWESVQSTNVTAPFLVCKHVAAQLIKQRSGSIINVASIAGLVGRDRRMYPQGMSAQPVDYAAAKAAVIGLTRDVAGYLGPYGVRVNAISPGGFQRGQPEAFIEAYSDACMLGRMGRDGVDLKGAAVFLASDASAYVTGHNLVVDGGFSVWK
jgi:NAD(P)-dependent dehydrogenase (short-subunit alcohol dehydrogenase family)